MPYQTTMVLTREGTIHMARRPLMASSPQTSQFCWKGLVFFLFEFSVLILPFMIGLINIKDYKGRSIQPMK